MRRDQIVDACFNGHEQNNVQAATGLSLKVRVHVGFLLSEGFSG